MPIAMTKDEWSRIARWTDQDKGDPVANRKREYIKYLDSASREMTKAWPNSLENVNKRNEEIRRARIEVAEQANAKFYKRYVRRQKEEQQRLMHSARDIMFKNKDGPKMLLSAVIESVIQKERMEQLKFLEEQRRRHAEQRKEDDDDVIEKAKEWNDLMATRQKRRFNVNKQHQKELLDQAHEVSEKNRIDYETELNLQKIDNMKATEQMAALKKFEDEYKAAEKARIWSDMERSRQEVETRRREQTARDKVDDQLINVLLNSRARVEARRKQTEKEIRDEKLRMLEKISQKLESGDASRDAKEQAMLEKAVKEKNEADEARLQAQKKKEAKFKQERLLARKQFLRDEAQRLHEFNTIRQWDIMNRFKNAELYEEYKEQQRKEKERKTKEYREDILRLWREREEREARSLAETRHFYGEECARKIRHMDNKLLTHAAYLLEEASKHQRPDYPLHRAIDRYCKLHRLYPMPELPKPLQAHFKKYAPWDGSKPDPGYQEPPPPPPDRGPHTPDDDEQSADKRNGLQDPKVVTSKPGEKTHEESVGDYKRLGKANGLQRKTGQNEFTLPPIHKAEDCNCTLK